MKRRPFKRRSPTTILLQILLAASFLLECYLLVLLYRAFGGFPEDFHFPAYGVAAMPYLLGFFRGRIALGKTSSYHYCMSAVAIIGPLACTLALQFPGPIRLPLILHVGYVAQWVALIIAWDMVEDKNPVMRSDLPWADRMNRMNEHPRRKQLAVFVLSLAIAMDGCFWIFSRDVKWHLLYAITLIALVLIPASFLWLSTTVGFIATDEMGSDVTFRADDPKLFRKRLIFYTILWALISGIPALVLLNEWKIKLW